MSVNTKKMKLTTREAAALGRIYGDGDWSRVTTRPCVREYNLRRTERRKTCIKN